MEFTVWSNWNGTEIWVRDENSGREASVEIPTTGVLGVPKELTDREYFDLVREAFRQLELE